jgi:aspartate-semialdehyde dehydrogenase
MEDALLREGHAVFSASPYRRYDADVPLCVAEANSHASLLPSSRYVKSPNCCSNGISVAIAPIQEAYGITDLCITTYQALSGRGDLKYPRELVCNNIYPIGKTEENTEVYIQREVKKVFQHTEPFRVSVSCQRVPTQKNHFIDVRIRTHRKPDSYEEVVHLLSTFNPLKNLNSAQILTHTPATPIVVREEVGYPRPLLPNGESELGMQVMVGNIRVAEDEMFDIRMAVLVDNIDRGAFGGLLQNAELVFNHLQQMDMQRNKNNQQKSQQHQQQQQQQQHYAKHWSDKVRM